MKRIIESDLHSTQLSRQVHIRIFLPKSYDTSPEKRYPVLYLHDGQNLTEPSEYSGYSWNVLATADRLSSNGEIPEILMVGIDAGPRRMEEYSHVFDERFIAQGKAEEHRETWIPLGYEYGVFIVKTLKPWVDETYRSIPSDTVTAGSSCGGNVSFYLKLQYPEVFRCIGAFSPAYHFLIQDLKKKLKLVEFHEHDAIYHDMGSKEGWFAFLYPRQIQRILRTKIPFQDHLKMVLDRGASHTELFWQARLEGFLKFAFEITV